MTTESYATACIAVGVVIVAQLVMLCLYAARTERIQAEADAETARNADRLLVLMEKRHGIETPGRVGS